MSAVTAFTDAVISTIDVVTCCALVAISWAVLVTLSIEALVSCIDAAT